MSLTEENIADDVTAVGGPHAGANGVCYQISSDGRVAFIGDRVGNHWEDDSSNWRKADGVRVEHPYLHAKAHRAELARLFLAEADHGEVLRCADSGLGLPLMDAVDRERYLQIARALDEQRFLYQRAASPAEVQRLLTLRGMPELGLYLVAIVWAGFRSAPGAPGKWCREQAEKMRDAEFWNLPTSKAFTESSPARVAQALDWAASRFDTFPAQKPYEDPPEVAKEERPAGMKRGSRATWKG